jgi:hypothetical protein
MGEGGCKNDTLAPEQVLLIVVAKLRRPLSAISLETLAQIHSLKRRSPSPIYESVAFADGKMTPSTWEAL